MLGEFIKFLKQYNVVGLAVAVIIGGKLNELVSSLVNDLLTPLIFTPVLNVAKGKQYCCNFPSMAFFMERSFRM